MKKKKKSKSKPVGKVVARGAQQSTSRQQGPTCHAVTIKALVFGWKDAGALRSELAAGFGDISGYLDHDDLVIEVVGDDEPGFPFATKVALDKSDDCRRGRGAKPFTIECDECGGKGEYQAYCNVCQVPLTEANVGEECDDFCAKCLAKE